VEVQAVGAGAVNQPVKAISVTKAYLQEEGVHIAFTAVYVDIEING
jgi:stage V sporulation protein SpoVS